MPWILSVLQYLAITYDPDELPHNAIHYIYQRYDWQQNQTLHVKNTIGNATKHYIPTLRLETQPNITYTNVRIGTAIKHTYQRYEWKRNQTLHTNVIIGTTIKHTYQRYDWNHNQTNIPTLRLETQPNITYQRYDWNHNQTYIPTLRLEPQANITYQLPSVVKMLRQCFQFWHLWGIEADQ